MLVLFLAGASRVHTHLTRRRSQRRESPTRTGVTIGIFLEESFLLIDEPRGYASVSVSAWRRILTPQVQFCFFSRMRNLFSLLLSREDMARLGWTCLYLKALAWRCVFYYFSQNFQFAQWSMPWVLLILFVHFYHERFSVQLTENTLNKFICCLALMVTFFKT